MAKVYIDKMSCSTNHGYAYVCIILNVLVIVCDDTLLQPFQPFYQAWEFVWIVSGLASCHDVMFQVWRPVGGSSYMLIGQTPFSPNATQCQPITTGKTMSANNVSQSLQVKQCQPITTGKNNVSQSLQVKQCQPITTGKNNVSQSPQVKQCQPITTGKTMSANHYR